MRRILGRKRWALAGVLMVAALMVVPTVLAKHSWNGYHWARTSNPFTLKVGDNLTTVEWKSILGLVATDWTASSVLDTPVVAGSAGANCSAVNGTEQVCNGAYGENGWLGLAQVWLVSGTKHIYQATAKVNDSYFDTSTYNNANAKRHVMCQEVGHGLGLGHRKGPNEASCMNDRFGLFSASFVGPDAHDYAQLATIYGHLDGSGSTGAPANGNGRGSGKGANDGDFGTPLPDEAGGRPNVFVKDLGNGLLRVTFVVWADQGR